MKLLIHIRWYFLGGNNCGLLAGCIMYQVLIRSWFQMYFLPRICYSSSYRNLTQVWTARRHECIASDILECKFLLMVAFASEQLLINVSGVVPVDISIDCLPVSVSLSFCIRILASKLNKFCEPCCVYVWMVSCLAIWWFNVRHARIWYLSFFSCSFIDLPNLSSSIYSTELCSRLRAFLLACPPSGPSPPVAELVIATADFQKDLASWDVR